MGISWKDKVTNKSSNPANMPSIESILPQVQLRWTGHVLHMPEERIPKALLIGVSDHGETKNLQGF